MGATGPLLPSVHGNYIGTDENRHADVAARRRCSAVVGKSKQSAGKRGIGGRLDGVAKMCFNIIIIVVIIIIIIMYVRFEIQTIEEKIVLTSIVEGWVAQPNIGMSHGSFTEITNPPSVCCFLFKKSQGQQTTPGCTSKLQHP